MGGGRNRVGKGAGGIATGLAGRSGLLVGGRAENGGGAIRGNPLTGGRNV